MTADGRFFSADDFANRADLPFCCQAEGETERKTCRRGSDGCFGAAQSSSVKDFRGWLTFPKIDFGARSGEPFTAHEIKGVCLCFDCSDDSMFGTPFCIDEIGAVADYAEFREMRQSAEREPAPPRTSPDPYRFMPLAVNLQPSTETIVRVKRTVSLTICFFLPLCGKPPNPACFLARMSIYLTGRMVYNIYAAGFHRGQKQRHRKSMKDLLLER